MAAKPAGETATADAVVAPVWRTRLRLFVRNALELWRSLLTRPAALLGLTIVTAFVVMALAAPWLAPADPGRGDLLARNTAPFWSRVTVQPAGLDLAGWLQWREGAQQGLWLGSDQLGRDLLSRIIYGARVSIIIGVVATGVSVLIGTTLGALAGYYGGWLDNLLARFADLLMAFPYLIFALGMMAMLGPGLGNLIMALSFKGWVEFFRLVRGEMLAEKTKEYVDALRALGCSHPYIIVSEILPNIVHSIMVLGTLRMGYLIVMEASLSYLGLGLPPEVPAWGSMVRLGQDVLSVAYWVSTMPGLFLVALVLAINLFGEGLRDVLDPRLKTE